MNQTEISEAIAQHLGWIPHPDNATMKVRHWTLGGSKYGERGAKSARSEIIHDDTWGIEQSLLPDYCNDLNAMREAERSLRVDEWEQYTTHVFNIATEASKFDEPYVCMDVLCATAAQRAEAFLRTVGKWVD